MNARISLFETYGLFGKPLQNFNGKYYTETFHDTLQHKSRCSSQSDRSGYKWNIVWKNVVLLALLHAFAIVGAWKLMSLAMWKINVFWYTYGIVSSMGVTAGTHRLWSHRSYKAKLPLRIFLMLCQTTMFQNDIYEWVRDHRVHHKFTDTDADPHNSKRGFFFSHIGWLMVRKHKDVLVKGKTVDMSDVWADPVVRFQRRYFLSLAIVFWLLIPIYIPWYFWGEDFSISVYANVVRYTVSLHFTWLVNSAAHIWGTRPYDKSIRPTQNRFVAFVASGEGWHNYHHVFPWDYKAAELGNYNLNFTTAFLDLMAYIGQAYDLKTVSEDMVMKRIKRTGEGKEGQIQTSNYCNSQDSNYSNLVWGWNDEDMEKHQIQNTNIYYLAKE